MGCIVSLRRRSKVACLLHEYTNGADSVDLWQDDNVVGRIDVLLMQIQFWDRWLETCSLSVMDVQQQRIIYMCAKQMLGSKPAQNHPIYIRIAFPSNSASDTRRANVYVHKHAKPMHGDKTLSSIDDYDPESVETRVYVIKKLY